jgi:hypothetical protein
MLKLYTIAAKIFVHPNKISLYVHRIYTCYIGPTDLYFVIISDIALRVRMSSAFLLALRHWIHLRFLINQEFVLE